MPQQFLQLLGKRHDGVNSVGITADGGFIASGSKDGVARVWDLHSGKLVHASSTRQCWLRSVAFSRDDKILASGGDDHCIVLSEARSGLHETIIAEHSGGVMSLAFSPLETELLASGCSDGKVRLVNSADKSVRLLSGGSGNWAMSVAFSPDGNRLACGFDDGSLCVWEVNSERLVHSLPGHKQAIRSLVYSRDGRSLISGSDDCSIMFWDASTLRTIQALRLIGLDQEGNRSYSSRGILSLAAGKDGLLAFGCDNGAIYVWDLEKQKLRGKFADHKAAVTSLVFSAGGNFLVSGSEDRAIKLWDIETSKCTKTLMNKGGIRGLVLSQDGSWLVSGADDGRLFISDTSTGKVLQNLEERPESITCLDVSGDKVLLACGATDGSVRLWQRTRLLFKFDGHLAAISKVAFSPNRELIASASDDHSVRIWSIKTRSLVKMLVHPGAVRAIAFSTCGKWLASGAAERCVRFWLMPVARHGGGLIPRLERILDVNGWPIVLSFSPDGRFLACGADDCSVSIWSTETGKLTARLEDHQTWVTNLSFSPDSRFLLSGSVDCVVNRWDLVPFHRGNDRLNVK